MQLNSAESNNLGIPYAAIASTVTSAALASRGGRGGGGVPQPPPSNINPNFQQSFTPQFSPTMQQQQGSAGATQSASPTQYATGGQSAGEGSMPGMPPILPRPPNRAITPTYQNSDNYQGLIKVGIIAVASIVVAQMLLKNKAVNKAVRSQRRKRTTLK